MRFAVALALIACAHDVRTIDDVGPDADAAGPEASSNDLTIMAIRDPSSPAHPAVGAVVALAPAVVTDIKAVGNSHGFFIQDPVARSFAGIYVFVGGATPEVAIGDVVRVSGAYSPYMGLEEIDAREGSIDRVGRAERPGPIDVALADVASPALQSMRVRVTNVVAVSTTSGLDFTIGEWSSSARIPVTSYMANDTGTPPFQATEGDKISSITGHAYASGVAKLAPMSAEDVVR